jgi:hypothetical protein
MFPHAQYRPKWITGQALTTIGALDEVYGDRRDARGGLIENHPAKREKNRKTGFT